MYPVPGRPVVVMQHCHPKGCYCQVGSVFKTVLFLVLIVGVSTALAVWIYQNKFVSQEVEEDNMIGHNRELDLIQLLRVREGAKPDVFIDSNGTLRLVSDLGETPVGEGGEFGPAHLAPAGERTPRMPLPVEAIEGVTSTKRTKTILEEILQHLDSDEEEKSVEVDDDPSGENTGPERSGWTCRSRTKSVKFNS